MIACNPGRLGGRSGRRRQLRLRGLLRVQLGRRDQDSPAALDRSHMPKPLLYHVIFSRMACKVTSAQRTTWESVQRSDSALTRSSLPGATSAYPPGLASSTCCVCVQVIACLSLLLPLPTAACPLQSSPNSQVFAALLLQRPQSHRCCVHARRRTTARGRSLAAQPVRRPVRLLASPRRQTSACRSEWLFRTTRYLRI